MYDKEVKHPRITTTSKILMTELTDKMGAKKTVDKTKFLTWRFQGREMK